MGRVRDYCLTPYEQFVSNILAKTDHIRRADDADDVLDQHT